VEGMEAQLEARERLLFDFFGGWNVSDIELLRPYQVRASGEAVPGEILDWLGVRTDLRMHAWLPVPDNGYIHVLGLPVPSDQIHAETIEYIALVVGIERALATGGANFSAMELGASYGPWVTAAGVLAERAGFASIDLTAVEASEQTVDKIIEHAERNGLTGRPDVSIRALHAAVHLVDEPVYFPRVDVSSDNGAQLSTTNDSVDYRGLNVKYDQVNGLTLATLCEDIDRIDFLHLDLQGAEERLMQDSSFLDTLDEKVATFFLATQSRLIEGLAVKALSKRGWRLVRERPTTYMQNDRTSDVNGWTIRDGGQLWLNPKYGEKHFNL
jgi:hypothetical protein